MMAEQAWIWIVAGLGLAVLEVILPVYIFAGFAIAAVLTGGLIWLGLIAGNLPVAIVTFALVSVVAWAGLRRAFGKNRGETRVWTRDINDD